MLMNNKSSTPKSEKIPYFPPDCKWDLIWKAVYHDGEGNLTEECLCQYEDDGKENRYEDIDRFRLGRFDLFNREGKAIYSLYLHFGQRLIFRHRNFLPMGNPEGRWVVYLVGWQMTVHTSAGNKNITAINYIFPDGTVCLDDERANIELIPEEH